MSLTYTIGPDRRDMKRLRKAFRKLASTGRSLRGPMNRIGLFVRREAARRLRSRPTDWGPRTTRLQKSLAVDVTDTSVTVGSNLVYAAVQQLGHPGIRPKRGKFLAIPVLPSLRRRGVFARDLPRESLKYVPAAEIRIGSHSWTGPALVRREASQPSGSGRQRANRGQAGEVMFALVKQVRIRGRPYLVFKPPAQRFALAEIDRAYRRAIGR